MSDNEHVKAIRKACGDIMVYSSCAYLARQVLSHTDALGKQLAEAEARADAAVNLLRVQWRIAERQRVVIPDGLSEAYHDAVSAWVDVNGFDGDLTDTGEGA